MADIIVGGIFFVLLGFALKRVYENFKSGSNCSCGEKPAASCGACPHCK